ncbi:MAG: carbamoyltransferase HypF, partial [Candidatus Omnitrophota bacterium]
ADNGIRGNVIGVAFDGTGFGSDGNIWGGEFFIGNIIGLNRIAHLKYIAMPGGEACIREPWRMAFSYLYSVYGKKGLPGMTDNKDILSQMIDKKINSPLTSSVGRLFDGVSSLIGLCEVAGYEGEAAIRLEKIIKDDGLTPYHELCSGTGHGVKGEYRFKYAGEGGMIIIEWESVIKGIVKDLKKGINKSEVSLKFHNAICNMIKETCILLRKRHKINKVCLSGGVFQNKYISGRIGSVLAESGFKAYLHDRIPAHDGGIALGQAVLAGA